MSAKRKRSPPGGGGGGNNKRDALLELFHETCDVFQLRDLEQIAPKHKAITQPEVREALQALVDAGLVKKGKIGSTLFFWSWPGDAERDAAAQCAQLEAMNKQLQVEIQQMEEQLRHKASSEAGFERLKAQNEALSQEFRRLQDVWEAQSSTPVENAEEMQKMCKTLAEVANMWTDNVFCLKSWVKNRLSIEEKQFNKYFEIPDDFDYLEDQ